MRFHPVATAGVITAAVVAVACGTSEVANDAEVTVTGILTTADGTPAAGIDVRLLEEPGTFSGLFEVALTLGSLGVMCAAEAVTICQDALVATTGDDGRYSFPLSGVDTKTVFGNPGTFVLAAALPPADGQAAGASVETRFRIDQAKITVPELSFWEPARMTVQPGPDRISYAVSAFPDRARPDYTVVVTDGNDVTWSEPGGPDGQLDPRSVADLHGALHITAAEGSTVAGVTFQTSYHTPHITFQGTIGPPMSRRAGCQVGEPSQRLADPCPYTDGRYTPAAEPLWSRVCAAASASPGKGSPPTASATAPADPCLRTVWVAVDLGQRRPVGVVFIHGLRMDIAGPVSVEASDDGVTWTTLATDELAEFDRIDLPDGTVARYLRLRPPAASLGILTGLTELSAWP